MKIYDLLAKDTFAQKRDTEAKKPRMKAYGAGLMSLLAKANKETNTKDEGKAGA